MKYSTALLLLLLASPAAAQNYHDPVQRPNDETISAALKTAYRLNGNSMVGGRMVDLTDPDVTAMAAALDVQLDPIADSGPGIWPKLDKVKAERHASKTGDICTRHGLRKSIRGKSWRCAR